MRLFAFSPNADIRVIGEFWDRIEFDPASALIGHASYWFLVFARVHSHRRIT